MQIPTEQTVKVDGVEYRLSKFTLDLYQEFLAWSVTQLPDPFAGLAERIKDLPPDLQRHAYDKAEAKAELRGTMADPDVQRLLNTPAGAGKVFSLLLRKHHPQLTEADALRIVQRGLEEHGEGFLAGSFPEGARQPE